MLELALPLAASTGYPPNIEPHPSNFSAGSGSEWAFFFIAGAAVVILALPWATQAAKNHNPIPLIVMFSGLICSLEEPMLDILGPAWTLPRMFAFVVLPEARRNALFAKMCREGGVPLTEPLPVGLIAPPAYAREPSIPAPAPARETRFVS